MCAWGTTWPVLSQVTPPPSAGPSPLLPRPQVLSANPTLGWDFVVRQTWIQILAPSFIGYVTLGK